MLSWKLSVREKQLLNFGKAEKKMDRRERSLNKKRKKIHTRNQ